MARPRQASGSKRKAVPRRGRTVKEVTDQAITLSDSDVAEALADVLPAAMMSPAEIFAVMHKFKKPILKAKIPGRSQGIPTMSMLQTAKKEVARFLAREEAQGASSAVVKAFCIASGEELRFHWDFARERLSRARFDRHRKIDKWDECLAMTSGQSNATAEIFICGTKRMTQRALNSVLCHEALHNFARRTRRGNPFLAEDTEHMAMALLGDPQLVHDADSSGSAK
ncbi:unnamed protein product [Effrenium voratum]|nr:unnamed protein product [Effrenium voratum]CAJ1429830.1 unnamed protein product [Effrenium voratum]